MWLLSVWAVWSGAARPWAGSERDVDVWVSVPRVLVAATLCGRWQAQGVWVSGAGVCGGVATCGAADPAQPDRLHGGQAPHVAHECAPRLLPCALRARVCGCVSVARVSFARAMRARARVVARVPCVHSAYMCATRTRAHEATLHRFTALMRYQGTVVAWRGHVVLSTPSYA